MNWLLAQAAPPEPRFFGGIERAPGSNTWLFYIIGALIVTTLLLIALARIPSNLRRPVIVSITFLAGMFWVLEWLLPKSRVGDENVAIVPLGEYSFNYLEAVPVVSRFSQILTGILLALGVYSIFRLHFRRLFKLQHDWFFSMVLLASMGVMTGYGFTNFFVNLLVRDEVITQAAADATHGKEGFTFIFDRMLIELDAAMFSLIAFFILSAAYRAFRVRSVEATIMMATALIVLLSFTPIGLAITGSLDPNAFVGNFRIDTIGNWLLLNLNTPALRAIDLGLALGVLAMGLRIMLGLERGVTVD